MFVCVFVRVGREWIRMRSSVLAPPPLLRLSETSPFVRGCVLVSPRVTSESMKLFHSWRDQGTNIWTLVIVVSSLMRDWWRAEGTALWRSRSQFTLAAIAAAHKTPRHARERKENVETAPAYFFLLPSKVCTRLPF